MSDVIKLLPSDPRVGQRDQDGSITQWPETTVGGVADYNRSAVTLSYFGKTYFVVSLPWEHIEVTIEEQDYGNSSGAKFTRTRRTDDQADSV